MTESEQIGTDIVEAVVRLLRAVERGRAMVREQGVGVFDGTRIVAAILSRVREEGGHLASHNGHHVVRQAFEDRPQEGATFASLKTAALAGQILEMLRAKTGDDTLLGQVAEAWSRTDTRSQAITQLERERAAPPTVQPEVTVPSYLRSVKTAAVNLVAAVAPPPPPPPAAAKPPSTTRDVIPLVARPSGPPADWRGGEYTIEEFVKQPTVG